MSFLVLIAGFLSQVGSAGAEGYCVNIPWNCRGVGDKDYVFAFQNVVLPIGKWFPAVFSGVLSF